ncbi:uncharacterized protein Dmoj_GI26661 [Drosophila mojavensis]|uniref:Uncharacterized protein n=1 Tax=Drosophila mojavensis TaxID=7230 RepID=A0A0Q9X9E6_DROMO|nr:uncharacterized protein Dmoj_GI25876 [Drosophila mojavensis]KRG07879.1 uncharacterized protein Dmoj_GI26661 [Drosophila mojavensis]
MIETARTREPAADNNTDKAETTMSLSVSEIKVLSIGNRREYVKPKKPALKFDKQIFGDACRGHFGQLLLGNRTPFVSNNIFMMDLFKMDTIENDNQPRRYHFECHHGACPGSSMKYGIFGHTLYASAVMHELKRRLKNHNWISKNTLEMPRKIIGRSYYCLEDEYYVQNIVHDILHEQRLRALQFMLYLHKEYVNDKHNS